MTSYSKDPDRDVVCELDARSVVSGVMRRDRPYVGGSIVKAPRHEGYYYECTTAGETSFYWPALPRTANATCVDGSVVWTARSPSSANLPTVSSVAWAVSPSGLTVPTHYVEGGLIFPTFSGGAAGVSYEVTATITWSTGQVDDVTLTVDVAQQ